LTKGTQHILIKGASYGRKEPFGKKNMEKTMPFFVTVIVTIITTIASLITIGLFIRRLWKKNKKKNGTLQGNPYGENTLNSLRIPRNNYPAPPLGSSPMNGVQHIKKQRPKEIDLFSENIRRSGKFVFWACLILSFVLGYFLRYIYLTFIVLAIPYILYLLLIMLHIKYNHCSIKKHIYAIVPLSLGILAIIITTIMYLIFSNIKNLSYLTLPLILTSLIFFFDLE
jgi:hypothetical protein